MATSLVQGLGIPVGEKLAYTLEDPQVNRLLEADPIDFEALGRLVAARNEEHPVWGFKYPFHLRPQVLATLRNPHLVVVFRDLVAIARRNELSTGHDFITSMRAAAGHQLQILSVLAESDYPTLLFSYEKSIEFPREVTAAIASFLGIAASVEAIATVAAGIRTSPADYVAKAQPLVGHIDVRHHNAVAGWAVDQGALGRAVEVELYLNGQCIEKARANRVRKDLIKKFGGRGAYGFRFEPGVSPEDLAALEVFALSRSGARLKL